MFSTVHALITLTLFIIVCYQNRRTLEPLAVKAGEWVRDRLRKH